MNTREIQALNEEHLINTYGARRLALVRGQGTRVWDAEGREYLDFFAGIAVANLGHCHPKVTEAIQRQAQTLVHVSNLYYIEPQVRLAALLSANCFAERWFFCNGGAEANEAAIKLARKHWADQGTPKPHIISANQSFHGRTIATITATGQPKFHEGFQPLLPGVTHVPFDDIDALAAAITPETGAVLLEPIQGEGGVNVPGPGYLPAVRQLCSERGVLLIFDEVQTGLGRTGSLFAYEQTDAVPDIITLAKGLGNGVPIGAMGCRANIAEAFQPGSHACTFGGNPLCSAAALATLETLLEPGFIGDAAQKGRRFIDALTKVGERREEVKEVRGRGLMVGVEMAGAVAGVVSRMIDEGILCGPAGPKVLRFVPPLVVSEGEIDRAAETFDAVLSE
jgi:predicted acetylornithine/succinylornithine family transaminase